MSEFHENNADNQQLRLATEILEKLRQVSAGEAVVNGMSIYHVNEAVLGIRERVRLANATLENISLTEVELEQLLKNAPVNVARRVIKRIRAGIYKYDDARDLSYCLSVGVKLEDLQTDEAEIALLTIKYHKLRGKNMVKILRNGGRLLRRQSNSAAGITYLRKWVVEHQLTLADIGTSDDELTALTA